MKKWNSKDTSIRACSAAVSSDIAQRYQFCTGEYERSLWHMVVLFDSKSKQPLFNARAWQKADNLLKEILEGYYSDPPNLNLYTTRLQTDGVTMRNKYGMEMIECSRGTNRMEAYHKNITTTFGTWNAGIWLPLAWKAKSSQSQCCGCPQTWLSKNRTQRHVVGWGVSETSGKESWGVNLPWTEQYKWLQTNKWELWHNPIANGTIEWCSDCAVWQIRQAKPIFYTRSAIPLQSDGISTATASVFGREGIQGICKVCKWIGLPKRWNWILQEVCQWYWHTSKTSISPKNSSRLLGLESASKRMRWENISGKCTFGWAEWEGCSSAWIN